MKYGFVLPEGDARTAAEFAAEAEKAGWDGFFVWEPVWGDDAWVALTAAAMATRHIRLGTMLSPVGRMRPWKLASETASLDNLSGGRVILSIGSGAISSGYAAFGEVTERKTRVELMEEGLEVLTGLWRGKDFTFTGKHYRVELNSNTFAMKRPKSPVQQPRIPIWIVGAWGSEKSMRRALRWDGLLPNILEGGGVRMSPAGPEEIRKIREFVDEQLGRSKPYEIVVEGETAGDDPAKARAIVADYEQAGATWWIEAMWGKGDAAEVLTRIRKGPPKEIG
jgi:alkanesulfonate monooxygenase SsuD/methylene tetrahydromethanopterin reductase-like flavin-dependent oxidoreductase (luciferase family)